MLCFIIVFNWLKLQENAEVWQHWFSTSHGSKKLLFFVQIYVSQWPKSVKDSFRWTNTSFTLLPLPNSFSVFDPKVSSFLILHISSYFLFPLLFFLIRKDKRESNFHSLETMCCLFSGRTCWWLVPLSATTSVQSQSTCFELVSHDGMGFEKIYTELSRL